MRWRATASISARSARKKTHARRVERLKAQGITDAAARAHPFADRARHRGGVAGRDRGRDHRRDHGAAAAAGRRRRHEIRRGAGRAGARAGSRCTRSARAAWCSRRAPRSARPRSRRCRPPASPRSWWRGSSRATCPRTWPRPRSPPRWRARACASIAPSPGAPICSPRSPACWWSTRTRSTGSTWSTSRSPSRRCRPTSRWSPAR